MATQNVEKTSLPIFPFTAIVGQEEMKLALELNVIDPKIGGVIIMGDRGTGKSTTIRAIADLLPEIAIVRDDAFNSHPTNPELMSSEILTQFQNNGTIETELIKIPMVDLPFHIVGHLAQINLVPLSPHSIWLHVSPKSSKTPILFCACVSNF